MNLAPLERPLARTRLRFNLQLYNRCRSGGTCPTTR